MCRGPLGSHKMSFQVWIGVFCCLWGARAGIMPGVGSLQEEVPKEGRNQGAEGEGWWRTNEYPPEDLLGSALDWDALSLNSESQPRPKGKSLPKWPCRWMRLKPMLCVQG